jgi:hypothetical protein
MLVHQTVTCPYCGAPFDTRLDLSEGAQCYIEDCYVCCQPIEFQVRVDVAGELAGVDLKRGDE